MTFEQFEKLHTKEIEVINISLSTKMNQTSILEDMPSVTIMKVSPKTHRTPTSKCDFPWNYLWIAYNFSTIWKNTYKNGSGSTLHAPL